MSSKKTLNALILEKIQQETPLSRVEFTIFSKLLGFLLRNDNPFPYSTSSLAENTLYKRASIFEGLKLLEEKKLIERTGLSFQRRFHKGLRMIEIYSQVQKLDVLELNTSPATGQTRPNSGYTRPETGYSRTKDNEENINNPPSKPGPKNDQPSEQRSSVVFSTSSDRELLAFLHSLPSDLKPNLSDPDFLQCAKKHIDDSMAKDGIEFSHALNKFKKLCRAVRFDKPKGFRTEGELILIRQENERRAELQERQSRERANIIEGLSVVKGDIKSLLSLAFKR